MQKYIVVICWSLSVLAALFVGQAINQPTDYNFEQNHQVQLPEKNEVKPDEVEHEKPQEKTSTPKVVVIEKTIKKVDVPVCVSSVIYDLSEVFGKSRYANYDNYQKKADTWEKIKTLDEEQLYEIYDQLEAESEKGVDWNVARILYSRMGQLDPGRAIAFAVSKKQGYAVNGVIASWSKDSPLEALDWIQNNKGSFSNSSQIDYSTLFNNVAKVDMNKALESLKDFDTGKQRNALRGILTTLESNEDFLKVIGDFEAFEDKGNKISSALYYWGQKSPKDALAFAQGIENENDRKNAERNVEISWMRANPEEAAQWIYENKDDKKGAVSTIVNNWDWRKSEGLYSWVQKQTDQGLKDSSNYNLINRYSYNNADIAKKALENIESEELRKKAVAQIYRSLRYKNQKAAAEFLNGRSEIPDEEKEKLISAKSYRKY